MESSSFEVNILTPAADVGNEASVSYVVSNNVIETNTSVDIVEGESVTAEVVTGGVGEKGDPGDDGYTPVKGYDYVDGREVELDNDGTYIKWRYFGESNWNNIVTLATLKGDQGDVGLQGTAVELQTTATHIQWRYVGGPWGNLVAFSDLKGDKGDIGLTGPANTLSIGTVAEGTTAATITGAAPNQTLNLTLAKGNTGDTGPANTLSIGTVTEGAAAATITGAAPNQTLNLVVPKGDKGEKGLTGDAGIGVPSGGDAGQVLTKKSNADNDTDWEAATGGHTIQEEGVSLTQRNTMNFVGAGVTVTDDGSAKTIVTIPLTDISGKVTANTAITGATKTKITYDAKGLVTAGADATTADIAASTDKNYMTNAQIAALHPQVTGGAPAITLGTANTAGSSPNFLRRDDTILAFDATALTAEAIGSTSSVGTASTAARRDHRHAMPTALAMLSGVGGGYAACATAIGTAAKTVALTGYTLVVGGTVGVTFTNGNSAAAPTLNINSAGAKPIFNNGAAASTIPAGFTCLLMYDGTNYNVIDDGLGATAPTTQAFGDTAVAGTSIEMAHVDHKHAMPAAPTATSVVNTPAGRIAATTVQAAINELDSEKAYMTVNTAAPSTPNAGDLWWDTDDTTGITSGNADTVDNFNASATPTANTLLALDASAMVPTAALGGAWTSVALATVGWSGTPTTTGTKYTKIGKTVILNFVVSGTSNSTSTSITLPFAAATGTDTEIVMGLTQDNGTYQTTAARALIDGSNLAILQCWKDMASGNWTASGAKSVRGSITYEAA